MTYYVINFNPGTNLDLHEKVHQKKICCPLEFPPAQLFIVSGHKEASEFMALNVNYSLLLMVCPIAGGFQLTA